jgi:hypothetical protein
MDAEGKGPGARWGLGWAAAVRVFLDSFGKILPLYLSLTFAPMVVLQGRKLAQR